MTKMVTFHDYLERKKWHCPTGLGGYFCPVSVHCAKGVGAGNRHGAGQVVWTLISITATGHNIIPKYFWFS
jgi:hypothetical protein